MANLRHAGALWTMAGVTSATVLIFAAAVLAYWSRRAGWLG
jgi:hypothetical protein